MNWDEEDEEEISGHGWGGRSRAVEKPKKKEPEQKVFYDSSTKWYKEAMDFITGVRKNHTSNDFLDSVYGFMILHKKISAKQFNAVMKAADAYHGDGEWSIEEEAFMDSYMVDVGCR